MPIFIPSDPSPNGIGKRVHLLSDDTNFKQIINSTNRLKKGKV